MSDRLLYNLTVPQSAQLSQSQRQRRELLAQGVLSSGPAQVESISADASTRSLVGRARGRFADLIAREFEELFGNSAIQAVPYFERGADTGDVDGYYALENVSTEPAHPVEPRVQRFDGSLTKQGTRRSHLRIVRTASTTESNPFGSASTEEIGIPTRARTEGRIPVRWYNESDGSLEAATVQRTVTGEHDDIDILDATEPSFDSPTLLYDVAYRHEWPVDVRVWDDRDGPKVYRGDGAATVGNATVGDATVNGDTEAVRWQRVFATEHDYSGIPIVENDRLRLEWDEGYALRAYRWDTGTQGYDRVSLGSTDWRLLDVNIRRIGVERVDGQAEFRDEANPSTTHNLNWSSKRGYDDILWLNPDNEGSVPADLVTRLDPIAHDSGQDPAAVANVLERTEVDR